MVMDVRLALFESPDDLERLRLWLVQPHVAPWWGDVRAGVEHASEHPPDDHRVITVDGRRCGYVCWQRLETDDVDMAGLRSLPTDHMDIDILIGEDRWVGRGVGPKALSLVVELLISRGVSSAGLGTNAENARACLAFPKAGFARIGQWEEEGERMVYFARPLEGTP